MKKCQFQLMEKFTIFLFKKKNFSQTKLTFYVQKKSLWIRQYSPFREKMKQTKRVKLGKV